MARPYAVAPHAVFNHGGGMTVQTRMIRMRRAHSSATLSQANRNTRPPIRARRNRNRETSMELEGKSAVITGAGHGIGRAIALALAEAGANVAVADIDEAAAEAVAAEVVARGVRGLAARVDVAREQDVIELADRAFEAFGSVEVLVNNAGIIPDSRKLWQFSADDFDWTFAVNVRGVMNGIRTFVPRFIAAEASAWVVNTGSEHSLGIPHLRAGVYTASKHAVLGLSDVLKRELPPHVGVSVLCPGIVDTTLWRATERRQEDHGGSAVADPAAASVMQHGLPAEQVGQKVREAIEQEHFFVLTHPHVVRFASERWEAIEQAFATQAPRYDGDEAFDVRNIARRLSDTHS